MGQGANATVKEATHRSTGHHVAIKIYNKDQLEKNQNIKRSVQSEIRILSELSRSTNSDITVKTDDRRMMIGGHYQTDVAKGHPCIMKLYDAIETSS